MKTQERKQKNERLEGWKDGVLKDKETIETKGSLDLKMKLQLRLQFLEKDIRIKTLGRLADHDFIFIYEFFYKGIF